MPTIKSLNDLLDNLDPFMKFALPLEAMKKAGFAFTGDLEHSVNSVKSIFDPESAARLDKELASYLPIRLRTGKKPKPAVPAVPPTVVGGFRATGSVDLDSLNPVLYELYRVGTIPKQISVSDTNDLISLSTLSQLCNNVPTAPGATLGGLQIVTAPYASASLISTENLNVICEIQLPVLGSQPSLFVAKLSVEIPISVLSLFTNSQSRSRFSINAVETQSTLVVNALSEIVPRSPADLDTLNDVVTKGVRLALLYYCGPGKGTISLPAELTLKNFPNTPFQLTQAGGATVQSGQKSFAILGMNLADGLTVDGTQLSSVPTPVAPFAFHAEFDSSFATDALTAVIESGDMAGFINRVTARHWWGDLLPAVTVNWGSVEFVDTAIFLSINFTLPYYCFGLNLDVGASISGAPVISNGTMTIDAGAVELNVDLGFWCALTGVGALLGILVQTIFGVTGAFGSDSLNTVPATYTFAPLPGSDQDWTLAAVQAFANDGTLTVDGTATLSPDPSYFIYLRIVTGYIIEGYSPVPHAQVTLIELENPLPAGSDVTIPPTGTTMYTHSKFIITDTTSFTPSPDQVLDTKTADANGNVMFRVLPASSSNPNGVINTAGTFTTTRTEVNDYTDQTIYSETKQSAVPEPFPDFGVTVRDPLGNVLATRQLVVLNAQGTHLGTAQHPIIVAVNPNVYS